MFYCTLSSRSNLTFPSRYPAQMDYHCVICGCASYELVLGVGVESVGEVPHWAEFRAGKHLLSISSGELCLVLINTTGLKHFIRQTRVKSLGYLALAFIFLSIPHTSRCLQAMMRDGTIKGGSFLICAKCLQCKLRRDLEYTLTRNVSKVSFCMLSAVLSLRSFSIQEPSL